MDDETSWIDRWIDKPPGEGGRKNKEGRPGWGKPQILETAGITDDQYHRYMVSFLGIFTVGLTDSISPRCPSAHRLCERYFDVTKTFKDNVTLHPAEYGLIVEKVRPIISVLLHSLTMSR